MDLSKLSNDDLAAIANNDLSKVSDKGLNYIVEQDKLEKELATIKPDTGFTGAFRANKERLKGDIAALAGRTGIMNTEAAEQYKEQKDRLAQRMFTPTEDSFAESPFLKFRELLGGSLPYVAAPLVAAAGAKAIGAGAVVGTVGAGLASLGQFTGSNISRQMQEDPNLRLADTNLSSAAGAAVPQAALDVASFRMIPFIGKIFGAAGKEVTPEIAKKIAEQGILKTTGAYGAGALKTAGIEGTTEAGQQFLERLQSGLNLTDQQARDEYFDSFIGGAVLGGTLGVPGTYLERGQMVRKGAEMEKEEQQKAIQDRQKAQQEAALAKKQQLEQTAKNLGVPTTLALAAPEQRIDLVEEIDPLIDPLGRFKSTDLSAKEVAEVNRRRLEMGKPRIGRTFSIEDLADVFKPEENVAAEGVLNRLIASRTGYTGQDIPAQTITTAAQQRGIDTTTQGFKDFLIRTTGTDNIDAMSPPQRLAVAQAIRDVKPGDETRILESGLTNAKYYTPEQYNDTLKGLSKEFKEMGDQENGISSVLKQIEKYSGLKQEKDQRRILNQAVKDGLLERNVKLSSTGSTIETFKPATDMQPLPGGMDIRKETFKQGDVPESYELRAGARVLSKRETQEEADRAAAAFEQSRQAEVVSLEKEVQKLQKAVAARNAELTQMQALGQDQSNEFFIKSANYYGQDQVANGSIADLRQQQQGFSEPVQVVPVGTKPVTKESFTFYDKDQPQVRFDNEEQAEQYGISRLNDETLQQIVDSAASQKQTGKVKRYTDLAQKELDERQSIESDRGIAITTTQGLKGSKERLEKMGIFSQEAKDNVEKLRQTLLPALKRFGLEKVALRLIDSIENGTADGYYVQQVIAIAMDSKDPMGTLRHESIHALKELGAFTAQEWKVLTNKAKSEYVQKYIKDTNLFDAYKERYKAENGNLSGFDEYIYEEAIAEAFRNFKPGNLPAGMIGNIWVRLNKLFEAISNGFKKLGFQTADDIFTRVEEGKQKPTKDVVAAEVKPVKLSFRSDKKYITPLDVQQARIYERELQNLIKKVGTRIAGMKSDETLADVRKAVKKLQDYTAQGLQGKDWYEKSAKAVLNAFDGNDVLAEKFFQVIAITSANTEVAANFTKAANAWTQFTEGRSIKVGTENENKKVNALLNFGEEWEGRKTNTFYTNLMEAMEGRDSGRSTIDLHMTRMIFGKDAPTDAQYELAENMVRLLASKLDLAPRQIQAASWVTQKAKTTFNDYRKKGWKSDLTDVELNQFAFERAVADYSYQMNKRVAGLPVTEALREPSKDIKARVQNITGEVIPSVDTNMSQAEELKFAEKERLTKDIANEGTVQSIADFLGVTSKIRVTVGSGAYEGKVNPNLIVQIVNNDAAVAEKDAIDMANAMSYVFKQDATPLFRADPKLLKTDQLGFKLKFDTVTITPTQQKKMLALFKEKFGKDAGFTRLRGNELVMINYRGADGNPFLTTDELFTQGLADVTEALNEISTIESQEFFGAKSEYNEHDWKEEPSGTSIVAGIQAGRPERPNIQGGLDDLRESFTDSVRTAVKKSGREPLFSLRRFEPTEPAERSSTVSGGIVLGNKQPDSSSFEGIHYSNAEQKTLNGDRYGDGIKGAEAFRLSQTDDPRIKKRVYFYIENVETGRMQPKEAGLGNYVHKQKFDNILAPSDRMTEIYRLANKEFNQFESAVIEAGYDGYAVPDMGMMVILDHNTPVNYEGTVQELAEKSIKYSLRSDLNKNGIAITSRLDAEKRFSNGERIYLFPEQDEDPFLARNISELNAYPPDSMLALPYKKLQIRAPDTKEFKEFFKGSKIVNEDGSPKLMYHGTARDITEFKPKQANAIFLTDDPAFAKSFADLSIDYIVYETFQSLPFETQEKVIKDAVKLAVDNGTLNKGDARFAKQAALTGGNINKYGIQFHLKKFMRPYLTTGENIIPVFVKSKKPFDYENYDVDGLDALLNKDNSFSNMDLKEIIAGFWKKIESPKVQERIRSLGFDGFYVKESFNKNLAVYEPNQVKSAFNVAPTESPDIRFSLRAPETPEFDNWFRDSLAINEDGSPMVLYHGTTAVDKNGKPYDTFKLSKEGALGSGIYMTPEADYANNYAGIPRPEVIDAMEKLGQTYLTNPLREAQRTGEGIPNGRMIPLFARIESPLVVEYNGTGDPAKLALMELGISEDKADAMVEKANEDKGGLTKELMVRAKNQGHDGIFLYRNGKLSEVIAFSPTQVKSVFNQTPYSGIKRFSLRNPAERFTDAALADELGPKSRKIVILMPIEKFLNLAKKDAPSQDKVEGINKLISEGTKFRSIPTLIIDDSGEMPRVTGHEGRHRARALQALGYTEVPVKIVSSTIRWDNQDSPDRNDYVEDYPTKLLNEDGDYTVRYPVSRELASNYNYEGVTELPVDTTPRFSLRSQLSDRLNERIGATTTKRKQAGFVERLMDAISPTAITAIRQGLINKYESIELLSRLRGEQFGADQLLAETSAIAAALQSDRAAGVAASSFRDGIPVYDKGYTYVMDKDSNGKDIKGLIPILEPLMKYNDPYIFQTFQFYAGTRRGRRLDAEGREKTFTKEDIAAGKDLETQFPEFATVFDDYQKYNQGLVKYMMDTGVISAEEAKIWTQNWDYIPFYRQIEGERTAGPKVFSPIAGVAKPKKLKGSEAPLDDFMETIIRNARAAIEAGMKNEAARRVIRDVVDFDLGERLVGVHSGNDIVTVKEKGETVYYRVADPLLVESLKGLNLPQLPFMSFLSAPADLLRNFVTKDPGFILANLGRDSMQAWITSGTNMTPLVDTFKQFGKGLLNHSPEAYALARSGLTGYDFAGDVESSAKKVEKELRKRTGTRTKGEIALLPITAFWDKLGEASTASDMATRAEVYKRTLERTGSEAEAFYQAMEVINFSRKGNSAIIRILSATIPFFNARVQGLDVLYRTGFGKAAMENKDKIQKAFIFRSMVLLGTSVMYWSLVSDDEDYKKLSEEERDNYWIIPGLRVGDKPFRFPIPFELGVLFKVIPERILEYSFGTDTGKDLRKALLRNAMSTLSFNPIPQAVLPIVENVTNYSFFTGEPVIGRGVEGLAPAYQFGAGTSVLARQMGESLNYSPQKIDNFIRGYTGTLGTYAMMMLDSALEQEGDPPRAAKRMEQLPVIKRFFASNTGTVSAYYDMKEEVDTVVTTVNMLQRTGNSEDLKTYLEENKKLYGLKSYVATLDKNMKQLNQATRLINASKTMNSDEKREALDRINDAKIKLTERTKLLRKGYE